MCNFVIVKFMTQFVSLKYMTYRIRKSEILLADDNCLKTGKTCVGKWIVAYFYRKVLENLKDEIFIVFFLNKTPHI